MIETNCTLDTKVSRVLAVTVPFGRLLQSLMVAGKKDVCTRCDTGSVRAVGMGGGEADMVCKRMRQTLASSEMRRGKQQIHSVAVLCPLPCNPFISTILYSRAK